MPWSTNRRGSSAPRPTLARRSARAVCSGACLQRSAGNNGRYPSPAPESTKCHHMRSLARASLTSRPGSGRAMSTAQRRIPRRVVPWVTRVVPNEIRTKGVCVRRAPRVSRAGLCSLSPAERHMALRGVNTEAETGVQEPLDSALFKVLATELVGKPTAGTSSRVPVGSVGLCRKSCCHPSTPQWAPPSAVSIREGGSNGGKHHGHRRWRKGKAGPLTVCAPRPHPAHPSLSHRTRTPRSAETCFSFHSWPAHRANKQTPASI